MKTCILYTGKYGTTEHIAKMILSKLGNDAVLINLADQKNPDISAAESVIIGSGVYMGKARKEVRHFCRTYASELSSKRIALYLCCMEDAEVEVEKYFQKNFPEVVLSKAVARRRFPGALVRSQKEGWITRAMFERMRKINAERNEPIDEWVTAFVETIRR